MRAFWIALFLSISATSASADKTAQDGSWGEWQEAETFFEAGKYEDALHAFRSHPGESAQYFHNVGTVYLRMGQPGPALAYLEKAKHLHPHDPGIQHNLQLAQSELGRLIGRDKLDPASTGLEAMADRVSMDEVRGILGLLGLIVAGLWLQSYLHTRNLKRTFLQPAGFIGLLGFAVTLGLYFVERLASAHPPAFVVERQVIRSGPGEQFMQLGQTEAGTKIRLLGPTSGSVSDAAAVIAPQQPELWDQIRYSQDGIGWIRASSLLLL